MPFNSLQFAAFFIIVFLPFLALKHKWQNRLLLVASCVFYAAWDWRFLSLVFISITTDYLCSLKIHASDDEKIKKRFLILSILINLSILGFFKYFNFFSANLTELLGIFDLKLHPVILKLALPLGISFYTFRTMSYTIDVYTGRMKPIRSYPDYALFVSFFPQLACGPIMRAGDLLPQIAAPRILSLDKFYEGCYLIFWGVFQKVFVADNLARFADALFASTPPHNGMQVVIGVYIFAFQIYCDFAGYSNMAIGLGKCLGFETTVNFNLPYFATNPADFWRRWHITLSTWLRDYIYTPIVISKRNRGKPGAVLAIIVTFLLCGLWHGAGWTFVIWGGYWGLLLAGYMLLSPWLARIPRIKNVFLMRAWAILRILFFFQLVCIGWLIFRAGSLKQLFEMARSVLLDFKYSGSQDIFRLLFYVSPILLVETLQYYKNDLMAMYRSNVAVKALFYFIVITLLLMFGSVRGHEFIYARF